MSDDGEANGLRRSGLELAKWSEHVRSAVAVVIWIALYRATADEAGAESSKSKLPKLYSVGGSLTHEKATAVELCRLPPSFLPAAAWPKVCHSWTQHLHISANMVQTTCLPSIGSVTTS